MLKERPYVIFLSGKKDNDAEVGRLLGTTPYLFFDLPYTAPYQSFEGIREFQRESRYHPFLDENIRKMAAVINLSEWLGHEDEMYLEIFVKYLYDCECFFQYEYVFTVEKAGRDEVQKLWKLMKEYLGEGRLLEEAAERKKEVVA